jgi:hypothetical protein
MESRREVILFKISMIFSDDFYLEGQIIILKILLRQKALHFRENNLFVKNASIGK